MDETPGLWFVELNSPPTADGTHAGAVRNEKAIFRGSAKQASAKYKERFAFDVLWNGLSIEASPADLAKIRRLPVVRAVYPIEIILPPDPKVLGVPELVNALSMTGADIAQTELGLSGTGIKVGVMDSGIDYDHPDLGGDGVARQDSYVFPTTRVAYGYDLVGDAYNADSTSPTYDPEPKPDDYPDDCMGHGTHVAGIVGADGTVQGVAPGVTFGAYRVFGCEGATSADIMIAAMEMALADGMDILNMSIGTAYTWPQYPTAQASDRLVNKGMVVVASIGNEAATGLYSASAPGVGKKVIGVASFDNTQLTGPYFEVAEAAIPYIPMEGSAEVPTSGNGEIVYVGRGCPEDAYPADPHGKIALIERGDCSFFDKALRAYYAGAAAVVVHNNLPGLFNGTLNASFPIPVIAISLEDGLFIRSQVPPVVLTWADQLLVSPNPTGGLISSFSSYGLSPDLSLKPDLGAPGGSIYSTFPIELGSYASRGGTSMASPHVAGAAALLLEAQPHTPAQAVRRIFLNSADPALWSMAPGYGFLDLVHRQGAGMLDIDDAILATTRIEPGKLSLGEGEQGPVTTTLEIENNAPSTVTYDLSGEHAISTGGIIEPSFWLSDAAVSFSSSSITVPSGRVSRVHVTVYPATGPVFGQYGGYLILTPREGGQIYRVPFAGFVGDYQGIKVLEPTPYGFPWLASLADGYFWPKPDGATYTMEGNDIAFILVHLEHQCRRLRMEVFEAVKRKAWHRAFQADYVPRNNSPSGFFAIPWDGVTFAGRKKQFVLPDGQYIVKLSVLKALGEDNDPDHWEFWTSPVITINRP